MSKILDRLRSPEPRFFKILFQWASIVFVLAVSVLGAEAALQAYLPQFSFTLASWASIVFKNLAVASFALAAASKLAKTNEQ
jgi:hypothetical protein